MSERQIELVWKCTSCGHKSLGRYTVCQGCGNPKDGREEYEMPADPAAVASVTDPELLALAKGGENWRCAYCGSDQRRRDGACANCGAGRPDAEKTEAPAIVAQPVPARRPPRAALGLAALLVGLLLFGACVAGFAARRSRAPYDAAVAVSMPQPPEYTDVPVRVARVSWEVAIVVERYELLAADGFDVPPGAVDVRSAGPRVHHYDDVLDHFDTEYDLVTVPDGYDFQTYTERVACGQDCRSTPQTCRQQCTSNRNGFATCRDVCSGGGQSCTTRYCSESRTRQVPRVRTERRPRQVPRYRKEPRYAPSFTWRAWGWRQDRVLRADGANLDVKWPTDAEVALRPDAGAGEAERERRTERYTVVFVDDAGTSYTYAPGGPAELATFAPESRRVLHVSRRDGTFSILAAPAAPASDAAP